MIELYAPKDRKEKEKSYSFLSSQVFMDSEYEHAICLQLKFPENKMPYIYSKFCKADRLLEGLWL